MNLERAMKIINTDLADKQNPDRIVFIKQWNTQGQLKGWWVDCVWCKKKGEYVISFDIESVFYRIIGDLNKVPNFISGKHQV